MTHTQKVIKETRRAMTRAGAAGRRAAREAADQMVKAADAALVDAGRSAQRRQRKRAIKRALTIAGKTALVAGTAAAAVMAVRARAKKSAT